MNKKETISHGSNTWIYSIIEDFLSLLKLLVNRIEHKISFGPARFS